MLDCLFNPSSIAVIGASNNPFKPGGRVIKNIKEHGYSGTLWAVNPGDDKILDLPTFRSIDDLPGSPDLAIIAIPGKMVRPALEVLAQKGARAAIILTSGFGEKDAAGKAEEQKLLAIAADAGMVLIGPNCSGFLTPCYKGKFAGIIPRLKPGTVDFISGSGATVDYLMEQATYRGLSFGHVLNLGNSIQMGVEDILSLFDEDYGPGNSPILMLYMEAVKKPAKLLQHARSLSRKGCTIIGIKSGVTDAGKRAAASHTGAMATNDSAVQALFDKAGIIRVQSKSELIDTACVLMAVKGDLGGNKICIITDAGGPGVMLSDELNRQGLTLPLLGQKTRARLATILPPESSLANPIDCLPSRTAEQLRAIFTILTEEEKDNLDVITIITGNSLMSENSSIYQAIQEAVATCPIPVIPVLSPATTCADLIGTFRSNDYFYFSDEVPVGKALGKVWRKPKVFEPQTPLNDYFPDSIENLLGGTTGILSPDKVSSILTHAGFDLPAQTEVHDAANLEAACGKIGFPLAMKVIGPLHKSDVGGVQIDILTLAQAHATWKNLMSIPDATGVLVQSMATGIEVIMGASKEPGYGHLIMFGLGGIYAETLRDVSFGLAPLAAKEADNMIHCIRSYPILKGLRGNRGINCEKLGDYLVRLGKLVTDFPQIKEVDLNPVKGEGDRLSVVDARIILDLI